MAQTEPNLNIALAGILQRMAKKSLLRPEHTNVIRGEPMLQPDILITAEGRSPVIVEAEFMPAQAVEAEALSRLSKEIVDDARPVEAVVALRYPANLKDAVELGEALQNAALEYAFFQESRRGQTDLQPPERFPKEGWLRGSPEDIADLIRMISVPQKEIEEAADALERSIEDAAVHLDAAAETRHEADKKIAAALGMSNVQQTRKMAAAVIVNALAFHERIAGMHPEIEPLFNVFEQSRLNLKDSVLDAWKKILEIDYYPIFSIAQGILKQMPADLAQAILHKLRPAAQSALVTNAHELTGRVFQRLISDRKYLAAFYTLPESAALLARLAVSKMREVNWGKRKKISRLKIADLACGTGALLSAVYEQIASLHERAGGNLKKLHPVMMQNVLHGCDVMPSAAHITSASLASANPKLALYDSQIYAMPFGRQKDNTVRIGSLELLTRSHVKPLFRTSDPAKSAGEKEDVAADRDDVNIPDESCDLVIMNPPFTRTTAAGGPYTGTYAAAFAAFGADIDEQKDMAARMKKQSKDTCYHGNAGMGSAFAALGDKKLKPGGVMGLVLPLTAVSGKSWTKMRAMFAQNYTDIDILSIAAAKSDMVSFSSDTKIAEVLIIARKNGASQTSRHVTSRGRNGRCARPFHLFAPTASDFSAFVSNRKTAAKKRFSTGS